MSDPTTPPGWYPAAHRGGQLTWWDGTQWVPSASLPALDLDPSTPGPPAAQATRTLPGSSASIFPTTTARPNRSGLRAKRTVLIAMAVLVSVGAGTGIVLATQKTGTVAIHGSIGIEAPDWTYLNASTSKCEGFEPDGLGDLVPGAVVTVYSPDNKVIGQGSLAAGDVIGQSGHGPCFMRITVTGLPKEAFYGVQVAQRNIVQFSAAEVASDQVSLNVGGN